MHDNTLAYPQWPNTWWSNHRQYRRWGIIREPKTEYHKAGHYPTIKFPNPFLEYNVSETGCEPEEARRAAYICLYKLHRLKEVRKAYSGQKSKYEKVTIIYYAHLDILFVFLKRAELISSQGIYIDKQQAFLLE